MKGIAYRQFCLRLPENMMNKIELIAGKGNATKLIHKILLEYIDINYPDVSVIKDKILFHEIEIARLQGAILNVDNIRTTQQQEFQDMDQFRDKQENGIMYMLYVQYVSQMADDIDHNKWMKTLKFDKKDEMLDYLDQKWEEYGQDTVRHHQHKKLFITTRMNEIKLIAKGRLMEVDEYMAEKNIDLDAEYEAGKIRGSMKDFKE